MPDKSKPWSRREIESPCVQVCVVHPETKLCIGCARSTDEIAAWSRFTPDIRRAIMEDLPNRQASPTTRRGGRDGRRNR
ncbi:MAG: DUF1289 domain-containing protein [Paracoccaceae bacterium]